MSDTASAFTSPHTRNALPVGLVAIGAATLASAGAGIAFAARRRHSHSRWYAAQQRATSTLLTARRTLGTREFAELGIQLLVTGVFMAIPKHSKPANSAVGKRR